MLLLATCMIGAFVFGALRNTDADDDDDSTSGGMMIPSYDPV
jgi:hypothetical protein